MDIDSQSWQNPPSFPGTSGKSSSNRKGNSPPIEVTYDDTFRDRETDPLAGALGESKKIIIIILRSDPK